ncbi:MAG: hypothetical protein K2P78_00045 [Gemmataceae bacterium]|nr:hypothetical protein [Gemmataceae bacterium]
MTTTFDAGRADAFAGRMIDTLNAAAADLMTSLGHRTGLFDAMAELPPSTRRGVAAAAGLNGRYVRAWLGAMTAGGVVEYDPAADTYRLPAEHAAVLTRATPSVAAGVTCSRAGSARASGRTSPPSPPGPS